MQYDKTSKRQNEISFSSFSALCNAKWKKKTKRNFISSFWCQNGMAVIGFHKLSIKRHTCIRSRLTQVMIKLLFIYGAHFSEDIHIQSNALIVNFSFILYRPPNGNSTAFNLRPKKLPTSGIWFDDIPVGVHILQQTVSRLCKTCGFEGFYSNHSLRATAATRLYAAGVDEQLIAEKTGHRSDAVRSYKRTSDEQLQLVDDIVQKKQKSSGHETVLKKGGEISVNASERCVSINIKFWEFFIWCCADTHSEFMMMWIILYMQRLWSTKLHSFVIKTMSLSTYCMSILLCTTP